MFILYSLNGEPYNRYFLIKFNFNTVRQNGNNKNALGEDKIDSHPQNIKSLSQITTIFERKRSLQKSAFFSARISAWERKITN